jgi:4-hydroxybenzoate polyprenyltransferase
MIWTIIAILLALWLLGVLFEIGGGLIHLLLIVAAAVLIYRLIVGGRRAPT